MVALEAMACTTPIVCSDIPPVAEATGGKGGFLVPPGDVDAFADKILRILQNKSLRGKKAVEARKHAGNFDWPLIVKQVEKTYKQQLS